MKRTEAKPTFCFMAPHGVEFWNQVVPWLREIQALQEVIVEGV